MSTRPGPVTPRTDTAASVRERPQQERRGAADPFRRARERSARAYALRKRLDGLHRLHAACSARGARISVTATEGAGRRLTASFTDRLTVIELRDGVRRAIENTELILARLEQRRATHSKRRLA